jgi:hypothetical protein
VKVGAFQLVACLLAPSAWAQAVGVADPAADAAVALAHGDSDDAAYCAGFGSPPDLAQCAAGGLLPGESGKLAQVLCVLRVINDWQHEQLACLEARVQARAEEVIYPIRQVLAPVNMILRNVGTLRGEVEAIACGWRFSPRAALFQGIYLKPLRLCRDSYRWAFGRGDGFGNAEFRELATWSSVLSRNLVTTRTGDEGDLGPESTWRYTATSVSAEHIENMSSPAEALRLGATVAADQLRARNSTMQMRAQRMLVEELLRAHRDRKRAAERGWALFLNESLASWREPTP